LRPRFATVDCFHEENSESYWTYSDNCSVPSSLRRLVPKSIKNAWLKVRGVQTGGAAGHFRFTPVSDPHSFPASWGAQVYRCQK
jgi:hypothetical protein